jgi:GNAT superfamily N-acetyltransferase
MSMPSSNEANSEPLVRSGTVDDIAAMQRIRAAVRENVLTRPELVTTDHYKELLGGHGKAFVCEKGGAMVGFCIVDAKQKSVWALFVAPEHERLGIGKVLLEHGMQWLGANITGTVSLTTAPETRATSFYEAAGWRRAGVEASGEIRFEWRLP